MDGEASNGSVFLFHAVILYDLCMPELEIKIVSYWQSCICKFSMMSLMLMVQSRVLKTQTQQTYFFKEREGGCKSRARKRWVSVFSFCKDVLQRPKLWVYTHTVQFRLVIAVQAFCVWHSYNTRLERASCLMVFPNLDKGATWHNVPRSRARTQSLSELVTTVSITGPRDFPT